MFKLGYYSLKSILKYFICNSHVFRIQREVWGIISSGLEDQQENLPFRLWDPQSVSNINILREKKNRFSPEGWDTTKSQRMNQTEWFRCDLMTSCLHQRKTCFQSSLPPAQKPNVFLLLELNKVQPLYGPGLENNFDAFHYSVSLT